MVTRGADGHNAGWVLAVAEEMAGTVSLYRATDGRRLATLRAGPLPHEVLATRDSATLFASSFGLHDYDSPLGEPGTDILVIDTASMSVRHRLRTFAAGSSCIETVARAPHGIELSPDERTLYVNCEHTDPKHGVVPQVLAYDLSASAAAAASTSDSRIDVTPRIIGTPADHGPRSCVDIDHRCALAHHLVASPDGRVLWMMAAAQGLGAIDVDTGRAIHDGAVLAPPEGAEALRGLCWSRAVACSAPSWPGSANASANNGDDGNASGRCLLLASGRDVLATVDPERMAWANVWRGFGVGQLLYSTQTPDGALFLGPAVWNGLTIVVDAVTGTLLRRIPTGLAPIHVGVTPDGARAFVTSACEAFITEIDLGTFALRRIPTGAGPNGLAILSASAIPAALSLPPVPAPPVCADLLVRIVVAVDMSGPDVPGRRGDCGCATLAGASTWSRAIDADGGLVHLGVVGGIAAVVVDYADLESDPTGATLASVVANGAPYSAPAPPTAAPNAQQVRIVIARTTKERARAAIAEADRSLTSVLLLLSTGAERLGRTRGRCRPTDRGVDPTPSRTTVGTRCAISTMTTGTIITSARHRPPLSDAPRRAVWSRPPSRTSPAPADPPTLSRPWPMHWNRSWPNAPPFVAVLVATFCPSVFMQTCPVSPIQVCLRATLFFFFQPQRLFVGPRRIPRDTLIKDRRNNKPQCMHDTCRNR